MFTRRFIKMLALGATTYSMLGTLAMAKANDMEGKISIDGSSTVFPITEAVAEEFRKDYPNVKVNVGVSGTGGGFKKFTVGELDISDASRTIKPSEADIAKEHKIEYLEIPVAYDGLTVVVNSKNTWVKDISTADLKKIWDTGSTVKTWKDVNPSWPDKTLKLYGPGTDSGTFDYFTEAINGKAQQCRSEFTKSEDDNVLVQGVAGDEGAMGFFGYAYYKENQKKLKALSINGTGPNEKTIMDGTYRPLSRTVFIYVSKTAYARPEVKAFVDFYLAQAPALVKDVGYVPLPKDKYKSAQTDLGKLAKK